MIPLEFWVLVKTRTDKIYLTGDLNDWNPKDTAFELVYDESDGYFKLSLAEYPDNFQFKFTRGSWDTEEVSHWGKVMPNRNWTFHQDKKLYREVENWKDKIVVANHELETVNVSQWMGNWWMPQLNRHRKMWVYLPPNYDQNSQKYPVLYMHDAQNIFAENAYPYQKWQVGRTLNQLYEATNWACIVVGIEHGEEHRLSEYSPYPNSNHGGGQGEAYLQFIIETLKPEVDKAFRTLPDAEHTLMIGSSMGGLVSIYAALKHGDVFGKVAAFSPSLWWSDDIYALAAATPYNFVHKMVLLGGEKESDGMLPDLLAMYYTLADNGYFEDKIHLDFYQDGTHTESFWGREFEKAIRWLMSDQIPLLAEEEVVSFNKNAQEIRILKPFFKAELVNGYGKVIYQLEYSMQNTIPILPHWKGLHALKCFLPNKRIEFFKYVF